MNTKKFTEKDALQAIAKFQKKRNIKMNKSSEGDFFFVPPKEGIPYRQSTEDWIKDKLCKHRIVLEPSCRGEKGGFFTHYYKTLSGLSFMVVYSHDGKGKRLKVTLTMTKEKGSRYWENFL